MSLTDILFNTASLADELEGAITAGQSKNFLVALTWQPVHGETRRIDFHKFGVLNLVNERTPNEKLKSLILEIAR